MYINSFPYSSIRLLVAGDGADKLLPSLEYSVLMKSAADTGGRGTQPLPQGLVSHEPLQCGSERHRILGSD